MVVTCRGSPPCKYGTTIVADASIDPAGKKEAAARGAGLRGGGEQATRAEGAFYLLLG